MNIFSIRILKLSIILLICLTNNLLYSQSKIDSLKLEVEAITAQYEKNMSKLYQEMLVASFDKNIPGIERYNSKLLFHLFPIEENLNRLLDSIDFKRLSINDDLREEYPNWTCFGRMMNKNEKKYPAFMNKIMDRLNNQQNDENLWLFSEYFRGFFKWIGMDSMDKFEKAKCIKIMANSFLGKSLKKQNLLKIADIIERK